MSKVNKVIPKPRPGGVNNASEDKKKQNASKSNISSSSGSTSMGLEELLAEKKRLLEAAQAKKKIINNKQDETKAEVKTNLPAPLTSSTNVRPPTMPQTQIKTEFNNEKRQPSNSMPTITSSLTNNKNDITDLLREKEELMRRMIEKKAALQQKAQQHTQQSVQAQQQREIPVDKANNRTQDCIEEKESSIYPPPAQSPKSIDKSDDYDDDFESYDDDFESDHSPAECTTPSELADKPSLQLQLIQHSIQKENIIATNASKFPIDIITSKKSSTVTNSDDLFVSPQSNQLLQKSVSKPVLLTAKNLNSTNHHSPRTQYLMSHISFSCESFDLYNANPLSAYQQHKTDLTRGLIRHVSLQSNEGATNESVQTEEKEVFSLHCQAPDDLFNGNKTEKNSRTKKTKQSESAIMSQSNADEKDAAIASVSEYRLNQFLSSASAVCEKIMEEKEAWEGNSTSKLDRQSQPFNPSSLNLNSSFSSLSTKSFSLLLPSQFGIRNVVCTAVTPAMPHYVYVGYSNVLNPINGDKSSYSGLTNKVVICAWNLLQPIVPLHICYCEGKISTLAIESESGLFIFAGLQSGSLAMWDLRENANLHRSVKREDVENAKYLLRHASFTSDAAFTLHSKHDTSSSDVLTTNHTSGVKKILPLHTVSHAQVAAITEDSQKITDAPPAAPLLDFTLLSTDENGLVLTWSATSVSESLAGSTTDFGLAIGSSVKLTLSETKNWANEKITKKRFQRSPAVGATVRFIESCQGDGNEYLLATKEGHIRRVKRFGGEPSPSCYRIFDSGIAEQLALILDESLATEEVTILSSSRLLPNCFLAGYSTGSIRLFLLSSSTPIKVYVQACKGGVKGLSWSNHYPLMFYTLDYDNKLSIWQIGNEESNNSPLAIIEMESGKDEKKNEKIQIEEFLLSFYNSRDWGCNKSLAHMVTLDSKREEVRVHQLIPGLSTYKKVERSQLSSIFKHTF